MINTVAERVALGVAWLDSDYPDWFEKVEVKEFDITDTCRCVLGQLFEPMAVRRKDSEQPPMAPENFGGYDWAVLEANIISGEQASELGFDASFDFEDSPYETEEEEYTALQIEWTRVINERKAAVNV